MSYRLGGRNALAYQGVEPTQPPQMLVINRPPTSTDSQNVNIGTLWVVPKPPSDPEQVWILVSLAGGVAHWVQLFPAGGGTAAEQFNEDTGIALPVAGIINVLGGASTAGTNMHTTGAGNTIDVILNDSLFFPNTNGSGTQGVLFWGGDTFIHNFGFGNSYLGANAGNLTGIGIENVGIGTGVLNAQTASSSNTAVGYNALAALSTGGFNTALGNTTLTAATSAENNIAIGDDALDRLLTGFYNVCIGSQAGHNYTGVEDSNIILGSTNLGVTGENNVMRLGLDGNGDGEQNTTYIAGTYAQTVTSGTTKVMVQDSTFKVGASTITSSDNSLTITITAGNIDIKIT